MSALAADLSVEFNSCEVHPLGDERHEPPPWFWRLERDGDTMRSLLLVESHRAAGRYRCRTSEERRTRRKILRETTPARPWKGRHRG